MFYGDLGISSKVTTAIVKAKSSSALKALDSAVSLTIRK